jgi:hypothetical protein
MAPQPGQVGRSTWPIVDILGPPTYNCLFGFRQKHGQICLRTKRGHSENQKGPLTLLVDGKGPVPAKMVLS